jgi:hypothetical protein
MPAVCEIAGCQRPAQFWFKGRGFCPSHGDQVIDRTHEMGLKVPMFSMSALDQIGDALGAPKSSPYPPRVVGRSHRFGAVN